MWQIYRFFGIPVEKRALDFLLDDVKKGFSSCDGKATEENEKELLRRAKLLSEKREEVVIDKTDIEEIRSLSDDGLVSEFADHCTAFCANSDNMKDWEFEKGIFEKEILRRMKFHQKFIDVLKSVGVDCSSLFSDVQTSDVQKSRIKKIQHHGRLLDHFSVNQVSTGPELAQFFKREFDVQLNYFIDGDGFLLEADGYIEKFMYPFEVSKLDRFLLNNGKKS